jgi:hypothetical protein
MEWLLDSWFWLLIGVLVIGMHGFGYGCHGGHGGHGGQKHDPTNARSDEDDKPSNHH